MNRLYISIAIIASVLLLDIYSHRIMNREEHILEATLSSIQEYVKIRDMESAVSEAENLTVQWETSRKKLVFFVSDKNLDEISDSIAKIKPLLDSGSDEILAEAEHIKRRIMRTRTRDLPDPQNIF